MHIATVASHAKYLASWKKEAEWFLFNGIKCKRRNNTVVERYDTVVTVDACVARTYLSFLEFALMRARSTLLINRFFCCCIGSSVVLFY
jgi:hypothetical protein